MAGQAKERLELQSEKLTVSEEFLTLMEDIYRTEFDKQFDNVMNSDRVKRTKICKWFGLSIEDARDILYNEFFLSILNNTVEDKFSKESTGVFELIGRWFEKAVSGIKASVIEKLTKNDAMTQLIEIMTIFANTQLGTATTTQQLHDLKTSATREESPVWADNTSDRGGVEPWSANNPWAAVATTAAVSVKMRQAPESQTLALPLLQGRQTIAFETIQGKADPYEEKNEMTYCSQTAQDNAKNIFGIVLPWGDGTAANTERVTRWWRIANSAKSGESVSSYVSTVENKSSNRAFFRDPPPNAVIADIFAKSRRAEWHRALAFIAVDPTTGKTERYILDPYRNKRSTMPIPLDRYNGSITRADFYTSTKVVIKKPQRKI